MAKSKKTNKNTAKPSVKIHDLEPEKNPKGGALFIKMESPALKLSSTALKIDSLNSTIKLHK